MPSTPRAPGCENLRHQLVLAQARFDLLEDALVHRRHDASGLAHVVELGRALDRTLPVHQRGRVAKPGVRQMALQRREGGGREVVVVHLDADREPVPAAFADDPRQQIHRMAFGGLHIMVRIADDVVVREIGGALRTVRVLAAAVPDRLAVAGHQHALMHVERPAIVAGQPVHVGRVADDQQLDPGPLHRGARLGQALGIFGAGEVEARLDHERLPSWCAYRMLGPPRPRRRARCASVAMAVSCTPVPVRSQSVIAASDVRPGARPAITWPSSGKSRSAATSSGRDRVVQFAEPAGLPQAVGYVAQRCERPRLDLVLVLGIRAHCGDVLARREPGRLQDRGFGGRRRDDDVRAPAGGFGVVLGNAPGCRVRR